MKIHPTGVEFRPDSRRVVVRSFISSDPVKVENIIRRALSLTEAEIEAQLALVRADFGDRHIDLDKSWLRHFEKVRPLVPAEVWLSGDRQLFIGALCSGEYALESAALFNPSIVPHPDQTRLETGDLRFILSLRATGEGHISSIEFRTGVIHADHSVTMEKTTPFVTLPELDTNPIFHKATFLHKLTELGLENDWAAAVMGPLEDAFTLQELERQQSLASETQPDSRDVARTMEIMHWLAESNYSIHFNPTTTVSERIIFPVSSNESNGIEDARFVRFVDDKDGSVTYFATYTAYNGRAILPQLIETTDFLHFRIRTLNGRAAQNKGMALFPRRIGGRYAMLSRQDDENLFLMLSDNRHFWSDPQLIQCPTQPWEMVKIGNCGSPIETEEGWIVITHGVGPMRKYCIGAILLDLDDPTKVIGRLAQPLLKPEGIEREGYVPNVVYTCGALAHGGRIILPYGFSDSGATIVSFQICELLDQMLPAV
ncbi:MAG: glycoside hydrolase family 130 protein [Chthoniobacterales bacterium]